MNQHFDNENFWPTLRERKDQLVKDELLASPKIRYMLGWVFSLGVLTLLVNLPIYPGQIPVGWNSIIKQDPLQLLPMPPPTREADHGEATLVTALAQPEQLDREVTDKKVEQNDGTPIELVREHVQLERINRGPILEFVDESPAIVGGFSTLYLSIDYPKAAREQGIEGLTVLMFVVEKDGSTNSIEVLKPLHPSLDSAAVAAVTQTLFKPGRQDGKVVRVKMRLPIRFKIVDPIERMKQEAMRQRDSLR